MSTPALRTIGTRAHPALPVRCLCTCRHHDSTTISRRTFKTASVARATTLPMTGAGRPPPAPQPAPLSNAERVAAHRRKAALMETAKEIRAQEKTPSATKSTSPLRRRFWQSVHVKETPEGYQIMLDKRPVRTPSKTVITIPLSKPNLAHAVAIEWDLLNTAQEAFKDHKIPMTSIVSRAHDIQEADTMGGLENEIRKTIQTNMLRYLDTDTILCWAPERSSLEAAFTPNSHAAVGEDGDAPKQSLRDLQMETAKPIIAFLTGSIWPGVAITPTLDPESIIPIKQSEVTRSVIAGWVSGLPAYELAALERAVLATKSLLVGARLVVEWSEQFRHLQQQTIETISTAAGGAQAAVEQRSLADGERFGIEEAARAASLEVTWQTAIYGEVEDTHDVEKEDVRRQLGSAVLIVAGRGKGGRGD